MPENQNPDEVDEVQDPDLSAEIASEQSEVSEPVLPPKDAPTLIPVGALTRRLRADFFNAQRTINASMDAGSVAEAGGNTMAVAADAYEAMAAMEEALRIVVLPGTRPAYDRWVANCDDSDLGQLYRYYMSTFKPGEAQPSPTS